MQLALLNGQLSEPCINSVGICPICKEEVIAKCGIIKIWHWSHKQGTDCDTWSEPETEWHINWKSLFPKECREYVIAPHRADVFYMNRVIEFQHSAISPEELNARENFYKNMLWVVDISSVEHNLTFQSPTYCRWRWKHKVWEYAMMPVYFHLGDNLYKVTKWTFRGFYYIRIPIAEFKKLYLNLNVN